MYEDLSPETMKALLDAWKAGKPVKTGPQNGRVNSEGILGRSCLKEPPSLPEFRDIGKIREEVVRKALENTLEEVKKAQEAKKA